MYRPVDPQQSFPDLELVVLDRWRERDVFAESLRRRADAEPWVFYEGPPTANGRPGAHHVLARVFKDIYPRYKTMRGYRVERKGGWDCHGLPVEIAVEKQLGLESKDEIEAYGIAAFNARCRESVFEFLDDWNRLTERIGFWIDLDDAYRTLDDSYVESVWWAIDQIHAKGLLYEGHKVVPYCPRCGTALSSHEVALGYRDVEDPSVYVGMPAAGDHGPLRSGDELLIWTTTPWTLVANAAIAAGPDLTYVRARLDGTVYVLAESLVDRVLGDRAEVLETFAGRELDGAHYHPPFDYIPTESWGDRGHTVLIGDFVSDSDGTGLVHTAIAFGEDDYRLGTAAGLTVVNPVRVDGTYDERIGAYAGRNVRDANDDLIADLRDLGRLFRAELREHSYPHCWRCGTPLIYYAKPSWYIATTKLRDRLLAANETVDWHPPHIKHGRFGDWLNNNVDWALSRERYWGTPLPIWRCAEGHLVCVGSFAELERRSGTPIGDPHRPYVDEITFACEDCGQPMHRVPEVIDVWFDSGAMPFAQHHAPFEDIERFEQAFPADFICEALDQTRGWFYSLLAISTLLFDKAPYRNVVCLGLILDDEGQKMSKSKGNIVSPWEVLDRFGADALRWYFFTAKAPWDGYRFSIDAVGEGVQLLLRQLWNTYYFFVLFANAAAEPARLESDGSRVRGRSRRRLRSPTAISTNGSSRVWRRPSPRSATVSTPTTRQVPDGRSAPSSMSSRTGMSVAPGAASGTVIRRPSRRCASVCRRSPGCWLRSRRSSPTRSTATLTRPSRASISSGFRRPVNAMSSSSSRWPPPGRPSASGGRHALRRRSATASRSARRSSWRAAASVRRSSVSRVSFATS